MLHSEESAIAPPNGVTKFSISCGNGILSALTEYIVSYFLTQPAFSFPCVRFASELRINLGTVLREVGKLIGLYTQSRTSYPTIIASSYLPATLPCH